jgi:hypothetical protein
MSRAILDDVFMGEVIAMWHEWQEERDVNRADVILEDVEKILEAYQNQVEDNHALRERLYSMNHLTDSTFKDYMDLRQVHSEVVAKCEDMRKQLAECKKSLDDLTDYNNRLVDSMPEGTMPKDVENLRIANAEFAEHEHVLEDALAGIEREELQLASVLEEAEIVLRYNYAIQPMREEVVARIQKALLSLYERKYGGRGQV